MSRHLLGVSRLGTHALLMWPKTHMDPEGQLYGLSAALKRPLQQPRHGMGLPKCFYAELLSSYTYIEPKNI